jgi:uncharacterized NAD(P)/FAD-binding protein YdhS/mannose-6-phosphate isomerase-like protein (cupin superfamily)
VSRNGIWIGFEWLGHGTRLAGGGAMNDADPLGQAARGTSRASKDRRLARRIRAMVERLQNTPVLGPHELATALSTDLEFDDLSSFVRFDEDAYVRTPIYADERFELRLLCWRPGQASSLHGHGDAACAFRIVRGTATEVVLGERDRTWTPGAIVEERAERVHQVMNLGPDPLLTLHAYSPPLPVDAPSPRSGHQVVVIGGGLSGAVTAYHLLRRGGPRLRVHVVERGPWLGRGIAFGVESAVFRLNVPASRMSIDPSAPDDFVRFAGASGDPYAFLPRETFGRYVVSRLSDAIAECPGKLRLFRDEAVAVDAGGVELRSGLALAADAVVLATGLETPSAPRHFNPRVVDAWDECGLATLPRHGRVLLLGAGLSALDVVQWLDARAFAGQVTMLSRHGLLPLAHEAIAAHASAAHGVDELADAPRELREMIRWVRGRLDARGDIPWQRAIDRLRPHWAALYRSLSARDRDRFVRHVRPYWDVLRHRAPVDSLALVEEWQREGRLERVAGRAIRIEERADGLEIEIRTRAGAIATQRYDAMVRCLGPSLRMTERPSTLLSSLLERGLARATYGGLGVETDVEGRLIDRDGAPSQRVFGIGAVRRASHWETTSVPDIAPHAARLAAQILA